MKTTTIPDSFAIKEPQNKKSHNEEPYNMPITMQELVHTMQTNKNAAPGPDSIHNKMKNIPEECLHQIFGLF